jgi:hypothetical protein
MLFDMLRLLLTIDSHIICSFALAIVPGLALVQFPDLGPSDILPPYVALVALLAMAIHGIWNARLQGKYQMTMSGTSAWTILPDHNSPTLVEVLITAVAPPK